MSLITAVVTGNLRGAVKGALIAAVTYGIGHGNGGEAIFSNKYAHYAAHGVVSGISAEIDGGQFGHGFASAYLSQLAGGSKSFGKILKSDNIGKAVVSNAIVQGTISEVTGGKFSNGAMTAAFRVAFNDGLRIVNKTIIQNSGESELDFMKRASKSIYNETQKAGIEMCGLVCEDPNGNLGVTLTTDDLSTNCSIYNVCPNNMNPYINASGNMSALHSHVLGGAVPSDADLLNNPNLASRNAGSKLKSSINQNVNQFSRDDKTATKSLDLYLGTPTNLLKLPYNSSHAIKDAIDLGAY